MVRSLLLFCGLALLFASGCNSAKTATAPASASTSNSASPAPAPRANRGDRRAAADQLMTETINRLGLDEAQATKFREISQRYAQQGRELRQQAGNDRQAARTSGQEMRKKMDVEISNLLNKDQQAIYANIKAEQREKMRSRRGGGGPGGGRPGGGRPGGGL